MEPGATFLRFLPRRVPTVSDVPTMSQGRCDRRLGRSPVAGLRIPLWTKAKERTSRSRKEPGATPLRLLPPSLPTMSEGRCDRRLGRSPFAVPFARCEVPLGRFDVRPGSCDVRPGSVSAAQQRTVCLLSCALLSCGAGLHCSLEAKLR